MNLAAYWPDYLKAVAAPGQPQVAFEALGKIIAQTVGVKLFTASVFDMGARSTRRVYTENPEAYPVGGFKPIPDNKWTAAVVDRHEPYASLTIEQIAEVFFDWQLIQSLGCESAVNIPVVADGVLIGALNLLDAKGHYTTERVLQAMELRPFALPALLLALRASQ